MPQMHCSLRGLLYSPYSPHVRRQMPPRLPATRETLVAKGGTMWARINRKFCLRLRLPRQFRDLLHAANLRHGTHGFTSLPKEGVLRIFSPWKILTASAGFEPANLGRTLPLDHRSRCICTLTTTVHCVRNTRIRLSTFGVHHRPIQININISQCAARTAVSSTL